MTMAAAERGAGMPRGLDLEGLVAALRPQGARWAAAPAGRGAGGGSALGTWTGDELIQGASIDSRRIASGQFFVALPGARSHGAVHAAAALAAGALFVLIAAADVERLASDVDRRRVLVVDDPVAALALAARAHRRALDPIVVGITGSAGKTTTKEMTADVLAAARSVHRTPGNYNNQLGVPLTLLGLEPQHEVAVIEMGMNAPGEIAALSALAAPQLGVLTGVGRAHFAGLGSREAIIEAKLELADALSAGGPLILPGDDVQLLIAARRHPAPLITVGRDERCDVVARNVRHDEGSWCFDLHRAGIPATSVRVRHPAPVAVTNALLALAAAIELEIDVREAAAALARFEPPAHRMVRRRTADLLVLDDSYNANPESMVAALEALSVAQCRRRIAVLGDMLELGGEAPAAHRELGQAAARAVDMLFATGDFAEEVVVAARHAGLPPARALAVDDRDELAARVTAELRPGDAVLVKASRALGLERVVDAILAAAPARRRADAVPPGGEG